MLQDGSGGAGRDEEEVLEGEEAEAEEDVSYNELEDEGGSGDGGGPSPAGGGPGVSGSAKKGKKRGAAQFFDEAAEDEEDEDEDDEDSEGGGRGEKKKKKKHKRLKKRSEFIDDIAEVEDEEEDDEEEDDEELAGDLIDDRDMLAEQTGRSADQTKFRQLDRGQEEKSAEEIARYIEERYRDTGEGGDYEEAALAETGAVGQQAMLPTVNDPKLWMVKCRSGHEREVCVQLLQKGYTLARKGTPLLIKSAFALDHLREYVYIEAEKEAHVRDAIRGLRTIFVSKGVRLVPLGEMVHAVTVNRTAKSTISRGQWVRVRSGLYKDDLAHVVDVDFASARATVHIVPRLDLEAMAARAEDPELRKKNPFGRAGPVRPPARPFSAEGAASKHLNVTRMPGLDGETYYQLGSNRYISGYLEKAMGLRGLIPIDGMPPLEDLQRFKAAGAAADTERVNMEGGELSALVASLPDGASGVPKTTFLEGDMVTIVKGDLKNLEAEVVTTRDDGKVMVRPKVEGFNEAVDFEANELRKLFKVGDRVRLISGTYAGEHGMVLQVDNHDQCIVISDTTKQELKVFGRDLTRSDEPSTGVEVMGEYQLHDLVLLDQATAGVIIMVQRDAARVLTSASMPGAHDVRVVRAADIQRKLHARNMVTTDDQRNQVRADDLVTFKTDARTGHSRTGTVVYVWRGALFVKGAEFLESGGFEVVRASKCRLRGAQGGSMARAVAASATPQRATPMSPGAGFFSTQTPSIYAPASPGQFAPPQGAPMASPGGTMLGPGGFAPPGMNRAPMGGGGAFSGRASGAATLNTLIGKTIRVRGGVYNGYRGRVKHETHTHVQVEFDAISGKLVTVEKKFVHDEAMLGMPRPGVAPSQGPPRAGGFGGGGFPSMSGGPASGFGRPAGSEWGAGAGAAAGGGVYPQTPLHPSQTPLHPSMTPAHPSMGGGGGGHAAYTPMHAPTPGDDDAYMLEPHQQDHHQAPTPGSYHPAPTPTGYASHTAPTPTLGHQGGFGHAPTPAGHPTGYTPGLTPGQSSYLQPVPTPSLTPGQQGPPTPGGFGPPPTPGGAAPYGAAATPMGDAGGDGMLEHLQGVVVQARGTGEGGRLWAVRGVEAGGRLRLAPGSWGVKGFVETGGEEVQGAGDVELVRPGRKERVKVVACVDDQPGQLGRTGILYALANEGEAIVKFNTSEMVVFDMAALGKLANQQE